MKIKDFDYVGSFNDGLAVAKKGNLWGFIDKEGNEVIPFEYEWTSTFCNGIGVVKKKGKYGFINKEGKLVTPIKYSDACNVLGKARIMSCSRKGIFDPNTYKECWN